MHGEKEIIGFIGLGGMGLAMATNLLKAGFGLRVYNRTADKARPLLEHGAVLARSAAEAKLWIATSGDAAARARVRPIQEALSQQVSDFGEEPGAANVIKLAGNF